MGHCCSKFFSKRLGGNRTPKRVDRWEAANRHPRSVHQRATGDVLECLFFPEGPRDEQSARAHGGGSTRAPHQLVQNTSRQRFLHYLRQTKSWIDVCIFTLTDDDVAGILLELFRKGIHVRIVCDLAQADAKGADIHELSEELPVVHDNDASAHMHHKFCVIDGEFVLNGSYNWTRAAATRNRENMVVSNDARMVRAFMAEFARLWEEFAGNWFPGAWRQFAESGGGGAGGPPVPPQTVGAASGTTAGTTSSLRSGGNKGGGRSSSAGAGSASSSARSGGGSKMNPGVSGVGNGQSKPDWRDGGGAATGPQQQLSYAEVVALGANGKKSDSKGSRSRSAGANK